MSHYARQPGRGAAATAGAHLNVGSCLASSFPEPTRGVCSTGSVATIAGSQLPTACPSSPTEHVAISAPLQCLIERGGYTLLDVRPELELDVVSCLRPCVPCNILLCLTCDHASGTLPGSACAQSSRQAAAVARPTWHCTCLWRQPATTSPLHCLHTHSVQRSSPHPPPPTPTPHSPRLAGGPRARLHQHPAAALPLGVQHRDSHQGGGAPGQQGVPGGGVLGACMCGGLGSG